MMKRLQTKQAPDPLAAELEAIDRVWGPSGWYVTAHEYGLRDDPDVRYHDLKRQEAKAIAAARREELRADLSRRQG